MKKTGIRLVARRVEKIIEMDITDGVLPPEPHAFSELHDYVDANDYIIEAIDVLVVEGLITFEQSALLLLDNGFINAVTHEVDVWLRER